MKTIREDAKLYEERKNKLTIGLLTYGVVDTISQSLWYGVVDAAREQNLDVICFSGWILNDPITEFGSQANRIYDLVSSACVDGLVIWDALTHYMSSEEVKAFYDRYGSLPVVSIGLPLPGIPSVVVDNYQGMRDVIEHLIAVHGYRSLAFIRGPEGNSEAEDRYRAYRDVLAEYNMPFNADLVLPGNNQRVSGREAMRLLLDERGLQPGEDFDAIVAANDNMALAALELLHERGVYVPENVAIVGFDNFDAGRYSIPSLTTVIWPAYEQGRKAVEILAALLMGKSVPDLTKITTQMIVRESCGCLDSRVLRVVITPGLVQAETFEQGMSTARDRVLSEITRALAASGTGAEGTGIERCFDALVMELSEASSATFLSTLNKSLHQWAEQNGNVAAWHEVISILRKNTLPYLDENKTRTHAENLWQQARIMISDMAERLQSRSIARFESRAETLRTIEQALVTVSTIGDLTDVLVQYLSWLPIPGCYIAKYEDPDVSIKQARTLLVYHNGQRVAVSSDASVFPSEHLFPKGLVFEDRNYAMILQALYFRDQHLGFMLLEMGPRESEIYDVLRAQISNSLRAVLLFEEYQRTQTELERAYTESTNLRQEMEDQLQMLNTLQHAMTREGWETLRAQQFTGHGYEFDGGQVRPLEALPESAAHIHTVPMAVQDQIVGMLGVQETPDHPLSNEERVLLDSLSMQIAAALDRARLFEDTRRSATRDQIISEVSTKMRVSLDIDTVLQTAVREIGQALNLARVEVRLGSIKHVEE
ncbi:MAG: substrate-binding domain-containing protein [Anaerolineae bacterium]|nr:substrate-binding domain-containing protein [Anaerolineae bacterium]